MKFKWLTTFDVPTHWLINIITYHTRDAYYFAMRHTRQKPHFLFSSSSFGCRCQFIFPPFGNYYYYYYYSMLYCYTRGYTFQSVSWAHCVLCVHAKCEIAKLSSSSNSPSVWISVWAQCDRIRHHNITSHHITCGYHVEINVNVNLYFLHFRLLFCAFHISDSQKKIKKKKKK